jgi:hypothetical protein
MAVDYLYPNGNDGGWDTSNHANCNEGLNPGPGLDGDDDGPVDGTFIRETTEAIALNLDLSSTAVTDADTVTQVRIFVRATLNSSDPDNNILVDWVIGGTAQGTQQETGHLTGSFVTYTTSDVGWNSDWTAAQLNGAQVRLTTEQGGMPAAYECDVSEVEVEVTYTPSGAGIDPGVAGFMNLARGNQ